MFVTAGRVFLIGMVSMVGSVEKVNEVSIYIHSARTRDWLIDNSMIGQ